MLKNISNLGRSIKKAEQKSINGGKFWDDDGNYWGTVETNGGCYPGVQCLNQWGRCTLIMNCKCANPAQNHSSCGQ